MRKGTVLERIVVLGFDARRSLDGLSDWTPERRSRFLIRENVRQPASVDRAVWQAVSDDGNSERPLNLWPSVRQLLKAFPPSSQDATGTPHIIEIAVLADKQASAYWEAVFCGWVRPEEDVALRLAMRELGYDVADRYLVSGLSNCMLSSDELTDVRREWRERISPVGLFSTVADAAAFAPTCDRLTPEHSPFFVYRIRSVVVRRARR